MLQMNRQESDRQLLNMNFSHIEEMDPCLEGGYIILYDQELPFLVRFIEENQKDEKHTVEQLKVRIMILVSAFSPYSQGRPQRLLPDHPRAHQRKRPLLLLLPHRRLPELPDHQGAAAAQRRLQGLPRHLRQVLSALPARAAAVTALHSLFKRFAPVLNLMTNGRAQVQIIQTLEYKELELIGFDMITGDEDIIRQHVTFKYGSIKQKNSLFEQKMRDVRCCVVDNGQINDLVRAKNPQLLLHIHKYMNNKQ